MSIAYIALGSNIGQRVENLQFAVDALNLTPMCSVIAASQIYETVPVGYTDQPLFLNAVVKVQTDLSPNALLGVCLGIESGMGRVRKIKDGPRNIDLDLLLYDDITLDSAELILPHPRMNNRAFVLIPLCELTGDKKFAMSLIDADKTGVYKPEENYALRF